MTVIIVFAAIAIALFLGAFITKRRFGLLGLALTAGATLSVIWGDYAGLLVSMLGIVQGADLANAIGRSLVVVLPAILLLFHGYTYKSMPGRIFGSFLFTVLAVAFLIEPIGFALPLTDGASQVYTFLVNNREIIISAGVTIAVIDLFFTKPAKHEKEKKR